MSQKWKPHPEVIIKHDDLYAGALESDFGKLLYDDNQDEPSPPSQEVTTDFYARMPKRVVLWKQNKKVSQKVFLQKRNM